MSGPGEPVTVIGGGHTVWRYCELALTRTSNNFNEAGGSPALARAGDF